MYVDEALRISVEAPNLFRVLWSHSHLPIEMAEIGVQSLFEQAVGIQGFIFHSPSKLLV